LFGKVRSAALEALKRGNLDMDKKDSLCTIVLRFYDAFGGHTSGALQTNARGVVAVYETNLLEDDAGGGGARFGADDRRGGEQRQSETAKEGWGPQVR
jgi:alpha-mannosidase